MNIERIMNSAAMIMIGLVAGVGSMITIEMVTKGFPAPGFECGLPFVGSLFAGLLLFVKNPDQQQRNARHISIGFNISAAAYLLMGVLATQETSYYIGLSSIVVGFALGIVFNWSVNYYADRYHRRSIIK